MFKIYFRQAWNLVKQNKLFTSIYVIGTGLAIALTMILFIVHYIKFAPIYPEENRGRTLVIKVMEANSEKGNNSQGCCSPYLSKVLEGLPHLEAISVSAHQWGLSPKEISKSGESNSLKTIVQNVNEGFWRVFTFRFLAGKPFTKADVDAKQPVAVIQEEIALQLFGTTEAVGERLTYNNQEFKVAGVVENSSVAAPDSYAGIWIPATLSPLYEDEMDNRKHLVGMFAIHLLSTSRADNDLLKQEVKEAIRKFDADNTEWKHNLWNQPKEHWISLYQGQAETNTKEIVLDLLYLLLAIIFIPALNLSGMISSRMEQRQVEIGVRKAYGASNLAIIKQVLGENLALTVAGGIVGLLIAYLIIATCSQWILGLFDDIGLYSFAGSNPRITAEMLLNPWVIGSAFGVCLLLNVISALIPTVWALRHSIIESLHSKL
ncbi:MAG: ABC transporter permease [Bacteroidaceae bacterium]|nr:ABC transporter permease [Bacteroidaceae bacterium]